MSDGKITEYDEEREELWRPSILDHMIGGTGNFSDAKFFATFFFV